MKKTILFLLTIITFITASSAQTIKGRLNMSDSTQVHQLTLNDGSVIIGRLVTVHADTWEFKYSNKVELFAINTISSLKVINQGNTKGSNDEVIELTNLDNNGNSEVIISPTALPLQKGKGFYETIWAYYHYIEYGLGKGFSIGGGLAAPLLITRLRWGMPIAKHVHIGAVATNYNFPLFSTGQSGAGRIDVFSAGHLAANATFGSGNRFLNVGAGFIYSFNTKGDFWPKSNLPIIVSLGGAFPISKTIALLSDNIIYANAGGSIYQRVIPSLACRYFKNKMRLDFGFWAFILSGSNYNYSATTYYPLPIPYISFGVKL